MNIFNSFNELAQGTVIDNAVHVGHVRDEDVELLKKIMRNISTLELDTIDFGHYANEIRKQMKSQSQFDRIFAEPLFQQYVREEFDKRRQQYLQEKQNAKDKMGLDTYSEIPEFDN